MHGIGNDYVCIYTQRSEIPYPGKTAQIISDPHFGIGSDGLVLILPSEQADFRIEAYDPDGTDRQMYGNAILCGAKFIYESGLSCKPELKLETATGIKTVWLHTAGGRVSQITVNMGKPIFEPPLIPVQTKYLEVCNEPIQIGEETYKMTCVALGTPHTVVFTDRVETLSLHRLGPAFEKHPRFPDHTNAEFVQVINRSCLRIRTWERGIGETAASANCACAVLAAAVKTGRCEPRVTARLNGGDLLIEVDSLTGEINFTGNAAFVFEGWLETPLCGTSAGTKARGSGARRHIITTK